MRSRSVATLAFLCVCLLATASTIIGASAQNKQPNLTGTWKMNAEKSKFEKGGPSGITIKFDHKDPSLSETIVIGGGDGDRSVDAKYTTDGKEATQDVMGSPAKTSAKWDGEALTLDWKSEGRSLSRKIVLSADGKTMTMIVKHSDGDGEPSTDTVILERQETKK